MGCTLGRMFFLSFPPLFHIDPWALRDARQIQKTLSTTRAAHTRTRNMPISRIFTKMCLQERLCLVDSLSRRRLGIKMTVIATVSLRVCIQFLAMEIRIIQDDVGAEVIEITRP